MLDPEEELRRSLDDVVGKRYAPSEKGATRRRLGRWLTASACALAAVATILWVLESHRLPKVVPKRVERPVTVTIVPGKPP